LADGATARTAASTRGERINAVPDDLPVVAMVDEERVRVAAKKRAAEMRSGAGGGMCGCIEYCFTDLFATTPWVHVVASSLGEPAAELVVAKDVIAIVVGCGGGGNQAGV